MSDEVNFDAMTDEQLDAYLAGLTAAQQTTARENETNLQRAFAEADAHDAERAADQAAAKEMETQVVATLADAAAEADASYEHTMALLRNYGGADATTDDGATGAKSAGDADGDGTQERDADVPQQARPFEHAAVEYRRSA